jgi:general secretion pathway protein K
MSDTRTKGGSRRGSALLAVLWLSAALGAIAFSLAVSVRGETERTATALDSVRAYYLATGAVQRALLYMQWGPGHRNPDGSPTFYEAGMPRLNLRFPTGVATVDIVPESGKLNINTAPPEELFQLLLALGVAPEHARELALAIVSWRTPAPEEPSSLSVGPSFRTTHASFEEIEELLMVQGMTPELFYGAYERDGGGRLAARVALRDCVTVRGAGGAYDVNTAPPSLLASIGLNPDAIRAIVEARRRTPFRTMEQVAALVEQSPALARLRVGGNTMYTLRATARLRLGDGQLSDERRAVAALIQVLRPEATGAHRDRFATLRWYDNVWAQ